MKSPLASGLLLLLALPVQAQDLPDFSRAGFQEGKPPPSPPATLDVQRFGAKGDGSTDDTKALQAALKAARGGGVVTLPPGRFVLRDVLRITTSGVVLRGAGSGRTVLVCPLALADVRGPSKSWSWSGGFIEAQARGKTRTVARVQGGSGRVLRVDWAGALRPKPGAWLELGWWNDTGKDTLLDHLYGGVIPNRRMGKELQASSKVRVVEWVRVRAVEGDTLTLATPAALPLRPEWAPRLSQRPFLTGVGIEGLSFEFPNTRYPGHLKERGYNGIQLNGVIDCWIRDVATRNADSGVFLGRARRVTVSDITLRGRRMHHGVTVSRSSHCLVTRWRIEAPHRHGTTITWGAHHNVFSHGWGRQLAMDAHRANAFQNLHSAITIDWAGRVGNPFRSGGSWPRGPHAARGNVYWNVTYTGLPKGAGPIKVWGHNEWPLGVFAGWRSERPLRFAPVAGLKQRILYLDRAPFVLDLHAHQRDLLRRSRRWF